MLQLVNVGTKPLSGVRDDRVARAHGRDPPARGAAARARVVHLSATAFGGGVAEINYTLVPLMRDAGLDVEWRIIRAQDEFFDVTKTIHNALQGDPQGLTPSSSEDLPRYNAHERGGVRRTSYDFVIVHDPQPAAMIDYVRGVARALDLALPHRPVDAQPAGARLPRPVARALRRVHLPHAPVRAEHRRNAAGRTSGRRRSTR